MRWFTGSSVTISSGLAAEGEATSRAEVALLRRAKSGDTEAFSTLVRLHERRVLSVAWRVLGNRADALDASQEVFLRLHKYMRGVDEARGLGAWLYRVVVNVSIDIDKRRGHRDPDELVMQRLQGTRAWAQWCSGGGKDDGEHQLDQRRNGRRVAEAIASLPAGERAALVLRDIEGLSTAEVAAAMGNSETTVRAQICHARAKLRAACAQETDERC
jgi:RNA polymerase sigma-70 factor (ECF subfamily)